MARIIGLGSYHPENLIANDFFNALDIGSEASWVEERTGIRTRTSVLTEADIIALRKGEKSLQQLRDEDCVMSIGTFARHAWDDLCRHHESAKQVQLDAVFCGTSVPDFDIPANACSVAAAIEQECLSFDVNSACSSFVMNLHMARGLLENGQAQTCAIFVPERYSLRMDFADRNSCVLFGDGSAVALVTQKAKVPGLEIVDTYMTSVPSKYDVIRIPDGGQFWQNGRAVQKFAVQRTVEATHEILNRNQLSVKDLNYFVGHQANLRMLHSACSKLELEDHQHLFNVDSKGNQGAAGAPSVLAAHWSKFRPGDHVVVSVVGSGLTWGSALLRYEG